jgi:hypothetical protein
METKTVDGNGNAKNGNKVETKGFINESSGNESHPKSPVWFPSIASIDYGFFRSMHPACVNTNCEEERHEVLTGETIPSHQNR